MRLVSPLGIAASDQLSVIGVAPLDMLSDRDTNRRETPHRAATAFTGRSLVEISEEVRALVTLGAHIPMRLSPLSSPLGRRMPG